MFTDNNDQDTFRKFISSMNELIQTNKREEGYTNDLAIHHLMDLECEFRDTLLTTKTGRDMYKQFMSYIIEVKGNNLTCKTYFRERQDVFFDKILNIFERRKPHLLYRYRINFKFAQWVVQRYKGPKKKILHDLCDQISKVRNDLCQQNLPLAIHQARVFFGKMREDRLDYMDLIQDASEGLLIAIDKHVPEDNYSLAKTAAGKMGSQMIDDVRDSSLIKLSPRDKRILYRARNAKNKEKLQSDEEIVDYVGKSFKGVTKEELDSLQNASQNVLSLDHSTDESQSLLEKLANEDSPENTAVESDLVGKLYMSIGNLDLIEQKIVRLKSGIR